MEFKDRRSFLKYFIILAIPVVIQQLLVNLLSITDTVMIGAISEASISATTVASKFFFIYSLVIFGISNGFGLFISQYVGARDSLRYNQVLRFGLKLCFGVSLIGMFVLFVFPEGVLSIFVKNSEIIALGKTYNAYVRFSLLAYGISQMMSVAYRVQGNSSLPMKVGMISFLCNVVLNYVLIFGHFGFLRMEIAGAALATTIARFIEMILLVACSMRKSDVYYLLNPLPRLPFSLAKVILRRVIPLVFNETIWALCMSAVFLNYCFVDEAYIPAITVVDQIANLVFVVFSGFATAVGVVIGNSLGANRIDQAKQQAKTMVKLGLGINLVGSLLIASFSKWLPALFSLSVQSMHMATVLLLIKCCFMWTKGYTETMYYIFRAGGDTKSVLCIDGMFMILGPLCFSFIFSRLIPVPLVVLFAIVEGINIVKILLAHHFYRKGTWAKNLTVQHAA